MDSNLYTEDEKMAKKGVYIDRENIVELIRNIGCKHWTNFTASELTTAGTA